MISTVRDTIKKYSMLHKGQRVLVAVSGGPDSMVLLHVLSCLREEFGVELAVAHLNHNLRGDESERDMRFVQERAGEAGLQFFCTTLSAGALKKAASEDGLQAAAREKRHEFLHKCASEFKASRIALGHTMDDQAETMLMRIINGSGLAGLSGIWPIRGVLIKPLIDVKRTEVMTFIKEQCISYVTDSSNLKDSYLRNDIRHNLLPFIEKKYNPSIRESLARTAGVLRHDNDFIEALVDQPGLIIKKTTREIVFDGLKLRELHISLLTRLFITAAGELSKGARLNTSHIEAFAGLVMSPRPNALISLPEALYIHREYERIILTSVRPVSEAPSFDVPLQVPGSTVIKGVGTLKTSLLKSPPSRFKVGAAYFDYASIKGPLTARSFTKGARIIPLGMRGQRKIKEIFIDEKVPRAKRTVIPIISSSEDVLWVAGLRQSETFKVSKSTTQTLMIEFVKSQLEK